jgi:hypothetical protein
MNTFNIFAILFIVTFVNTTKSISYSTIAQSLVQLHDVPTEGLAKLNEVAESWSDSHKSLDAVIEANADMCERLVGLQQTVQLSLSSTVKAVNLKIEALAHATAENKNILKDNVAHQVGEVAKIKEASAELKKEADTLVKKDAELDETVAVLIRLKNIARDELAGNTKITTEMGKYNVVSKHGVSFIQRANLKEELHGLLQKSHTAAKSLISTLIMMASNDDGHYSDPKIVAKIMAVLDKIIGSNSLKKSNLQTEFQKDTVMTQEIIGNAQEMVQNLQEGSIKAEYGIELNNKETLMYNRDLEFLAQAGTRRAGRVAFNAAFCAEQKKRMGRYTAEFATEVKSINELKAIFA